MKSLITLFIFSLSISVFSQESDKISLEDSYFDAILAREWVKTDSLGKILEIKYKKENKIADLLNYKGFELYHKGAYKEALESYLKARTLYIEKKNIEKQAKVESSIVEVIGYLDKCLVDYRTYLNSLCKLGKITNSKTVLWDCEYYKGYFKEIKNKFEEALEHYRETSKITLRFKDTLAYYSTQMNVGKMLIALKKYDQGIDVLKKAEKYYSNVGIVDRNFLIHIYKSDAFKENNNFVLAFKELDKAKKLLKEYPSIQDYYDLYDQYSNVYESNKQFKKALESQKLAQVYKDTLNFVRADQDIYQIKAKYDVVEKDNKIISLENENLALKIKENKNLILILVISNAFMILLIFLYILLKRFNENKKELLELRDLLDSFEKKTIEEKKSETILLKSNALVKSSQLLYIKSDGHYVEFYLDTKEKPEIDRNTMKGVLEMIPTNLFVRIHKSYIVNINRIKIINSNQLMLDTGVWIPLSRTYKHQLKDILHKK